MNQSLRTSPRRGRIRAAHRFRGIGLASAVTLLPASLFVPTVCLLLAPAALAQQRDTVVEELIVTARKREENALEVPESLTTFSGAVVERANINGLSDIGLLVPNLYMSTRLDGFPNVSIRGLGGFGNTQGVGFYLDDVQLFSDASSRFGDLERVEVLKGPQGILYGGSNIGGAVKFVAKRPDPSAFSGHAKLRVGEDSYYDGEVQLNIPLSDDWAMRVFAFADTDDSFLVNPNSPRANGQRNSNDPDVGQREQVGVRLALAGDLSDRMSLYGTLRYNDFDGPNNVWSVEPDGNLRHTNLVDTSFNPRHDKETLAGSLELNYRWDNVALTSITSLTDTDSNRQTDLDVTQEFVLDLFRPQRLDVLTQELRFSSTGPGPLQWQAGGYLLDYDRDIGSELLVLGAFCFLDPGVCDPLGPEEMDLLVALPFEVSTQQRQQQALFANFSYRAESIEFSAGVRVDDWESKRTNLDSGLSGSESQTETLLRGSLAWFSEDERSMFYGTVSQGFEPGDFNLANFAGESSLFGYGPEEATQFELGYKGRLMHDRVVLVLSAFLIDYQDRQFELQAADPSGGFVEGIINAGDSEQWGLEGDLLWYLNDNWNLSLGFGYVDAEWDNGTISPVTGSDISGQTPPNTADFSAVGALDYSHDLNAESRVFGRLQVRHKGDSSTNAQFFDAPGDDFPAWDNPSYTVVDLGGGWERGPWTFDVHIENLFDEEYYIDVQEFPNFAGSARPGAPGAIVIGTLEQPRRVVFSVRYDFN